MHALVFRFRSGLLFYLWGWFILLLVSGCSEEQTDSENLRFPDPGLTLASVEYKSVDDEIFFDATLEALHQSTVASETNARVVEVPFDVNDYVEKGQVIVRFRDTDQKALLSRTQASLSEAEARLVNDRMEYERAEKVFERNVISRAQMDSLTAAYESSKARVKAAEAEVKRANEQVEHTIIRAPFAGMVVERHIQVGETATIGQPLMTGLSLEHLRALVDIPQYHIAALRQHLRARIVLPDGRSIEASEIRIPPTADPESHSFRVLVNLPSEDLGVFPGTLVKVAFARGKTDRLVVPEQALVQRGEVTGLYIVDNNNRVTFRYVRAATRTAEGLISLVSGADAGEKVALDTVQAARVYKEQTPENGSL